jgi:hypothetical protein
MLKRPVLFVLAALFVASCNGGPPGRETAVASRPPARPLIIIPGLEGSRLVSVETGEAVWSASLPLLVAGRGLEKLALPVADAGSERPVEDLRPDGIIRRVLAADFYGDLITTLERDAGYDCVAPEQIVNGTNCVILAWDWRSDLVEAAGVLDQTIRRLRDATGDPDLRADVVAHSAGALVVQYYVRYGSADVLDAPLPARPPMTGAGSLGTVLLAAPPNFGSIFGLQRVMRGSRIGLARVPPELMATIPASTSFCRIRIAAGWPVWTDRILRLTFMMPAHGAN